MSSKAKPTPYQVFMLALCLFALFSIGYEHIVQIDAQVKQILELSDFAVCCVFFLDFTYNMARARNKWRYFYTWGWIDLLSSVPYIDVLRFGRVSRILRIIRILRSFKATKILAEFILERRKESVFLAAALITILIIIFSSISVLSFEKGAPSSNIQTAEEAVWWSVVTMTTVGFGDKYPVTFEGRVIACLLMVTGIGLFGMFSGFIASWFISPETICKEDDIQAIRRDVEEIKKAILNDKK